MPLHPWGYRKSAGLTEKRSFNVDPHAVRFTSELSRHTIIMYLAICVKNTFNLTLHVDSGLTGHSSFVSVLHRDWDKYTRCFTLSAHRRSVPESETWQILNINAAFKHISAYLLGAIFTSCNYLKHLSVKVPSAAVKSIMYRTMV